MIPIDFSHRLKGIVNERRAFSVACLVGVLATVLSSVGATSRAGDWPQFKRNAMRTGDAGEEMLRFPLDYQQALTDQFLDSRGRDGLVEASGCALPVFANGLWYSHKGLWKGGVLTAILARDPARSQKGRGNDKILWSWNFGSNACISPSFGYGRMYAVTNGEGVVYCFEADAD